MLITRGTCGSIWHLKHVFAMNGHNLIFVAPVRLELKKGAKDAGSEFRVNGVPITAHLTAFDEMGFEAIVEDVSVLCENAEQGFRGQSPPFEKLFAVLWLHIEVAVRLTSAVLPRLVAHGSGNILNAASIAAFETRPIVATYHAAKAFFFSLSESLTKEGSDTCLTVVARCPGAVDTALLDKAGMEESRALQKAYLKKPRAVAESARKVGIAGERMVILGALNKASGSARWLTTESAHAGSSQEFYEDMPAGDYGGGWDEEIFHAGNTRQLIRC